MKRILTVAATALLLTACNTNTPTEQIAEPSVKADTVQQNAIETTDSTPKVSAVEVQSDVAASDVKVKGKETSAADYIRKMNQLGVPCFIDPKDNSLHIELMENISGNYNELASYTLREAISNGVKGITSCKVYYDRELVGTATIGNK